MPSQSKSKSSQYLILDCALCGSPFRTFPSEVRARNRRYCTYKCGTLARTIPLLTRFSMYCVCDIVTRCWMWTGLLDKRGYGLIGATGKAGAHARFAHRVAHILFMGPIPPRMNVLHRCDNRACVNPGHLFLGTQKDNVHDMVRKGRGHRSLDEQRVRAILGFHAGGRSIKSLAREFGVSETTIARVVHGETWRHVSMPDLVAESG